MAELMEALVVVEEGSKTDVMEEVSCCFASICFF